MKEEDWKKFRQQLNRLVEIIPNILPSEEPWNLHLIAWLHSIDCVECHTTLWFALLDGEDYGKTIVKIVKHALICGIESSLPPLPLDVGAMSLQNVITDGSISSGNEKLDVSLKLDDLP